MGNALRQAEPVDDALVQLEHSIAKGLIRVGGGNARTRGKDARDVKEIRVANHRVLEPVIVCDALYVELAALCKLLDDDSPVA